MQVTTVGIDIAKHVFQVHGVSATGEVLLRKRLRRAELLPFLQQLEPCLVGMEACGTSHHWARELTRLGHTVKLMPPSYVKAYVRRNKNDAADAEAICEAVTRPAMRFVPIKNMEQQAVLIMHRVRAVLVRQRTMMANALRGHMAEFGIIAPQGLKAVRDLARLIEDPSLSIPDLEHISAELNRGIPKTFWMGESARVDSFMEANDAEAMFPGSARALDRSRRIWRVAT